MKTKPVQDISPRPADDRGHWRDAATSSALQVKRGLTIGALARASGMAPSAIRYYERLGLMPAPLRRSGWRTYDPADIRRLKLLTTARALGFSLRQLKSLGQTLADRASLTSAFGAKAAEIDARIETLTRTRATLAAMLACDCGDARTCERVG